MAEKEDNLLLDPSLKSADILRIKVPLTKGNEKYRQFFHSASELSKKSNVFQEMINTVDCKECSKDIIWIRDFLPHTVQQFLNFLNGKDIYVCSTDGMIDLMMMADKYLVEDLMQRTQEILATRFDHTNVLNMYQSIYLLQTKALKEKWESFISIYFSALAMSYDFLHLDHQTVQSILSLDALNVKTELEVYNAVYRWSRERCIESRFCICESHMLKVGEQLFACVRYGNLTEEEKKNVFASLLEKDVNIQINKPRQIDDFESFNLQFLDKMPCVGRDKYWSTVTTLNSDEYYTCFTFIPATESIYLVGFHGIVLFNSYNFNFKMCLYCDSIIEISEKNIYTCSGLTRKENKKPDRVYYLLKKPVELRRDCVYTVQVMFRSTSEAPVFTNDHKDDTEFKYFKISGTTSHISGIYYIPLTHLNKK